MQLKDTISNNSFYKGEYSFTHREREEGIIILRVQAHREYVVHNCIAAGLFLNKSASHGVD